MAPARATARGAVSANDGPPQSLLGRRGQGRLGWGWIETHALSATRPPYPSTPTDAERALVGSTSPSSRPADDVSDPAGARGLLGGLHSLQPWLAPVWGDGAYGGRSLAAWAEGRGVRVEVVRRREGQRGVAVRPRRWVVERTFAWLGRYCRLSKDYERRRQSAEALIQLAMVRLMLRRLARPAL